MQNISLEYLIYDDKTCEKVIRLNIWLQQQKWKAKTFNS